MALTTGPCPNGGPEDNEGPVGFPTRTTSVTDHGDITRFLESKRSNKAILRAADGHAPTASKKLKTFPGGKNLAKEAKKKKKKGAFGEAYTPVEAKGKGVRVAESTRGPLGQKLESFDDSEQDRSASGLTA